MTPRRRPTVVVVGAGIAGLAAAWELTGGSSGTDGSSGVDVVVVEGDERIGGKLASSEFAGRTVDLAADAFLARRPEATDLCAELGLDGQLVPVGASGASLWARGRLRAMPAGLNLGVPTRWWPLFRSGVLSPAESIGAALDLARPHLRPGPIVGDRTVGDIVGQRLGRPVVERLVDPLVGGIHAGNVDDLSAAATFPVLIAADRRSGSLMRSLRRSLSATPATPGFEPATPLFWSLSGSTASLAAQLGAVLSDRGVTIVTGARVDELERRVGAGGTRPWHLTLDRAGRAGPETGQNPVGAGLDADGVVIAVPARAAAILLAPHAGESAATLSAVRYASVAVVTLSVPSEAIGAPLSGTGFLVPRTSAVGGTPGLVTGCTYLSRKWPHLARDGDELVRVSVGRFGDERHRSMGDDELVAAVFSELATVLSVKGGPTESMVTRWDDAFPQYELGHLVRMAKITDEVGAVGGLAVAGATYRGVGIPACIGSGRDAARRVLEPLATGAAGAGSAT